MRAMIERAMGQAVAVGPRETGVIEGAEGLTTALRRLVDHSAHQADRIDEMGDRLDAQSRALEGQSVRLAALVRARKETSDGLGALMDRIALLEERAGAAEREAMALAAANRRLIRLLKRSGEASPPSASAPDIAWEKPERTQASGPDLSEASVRREVPDTKALREKQRSGLSKGAECFSGREMADARALGRALRAMAAERPEHAKRLTGKPVEEHGPPLRPTAAGQAPDAAGRGAKAS